MYIYMLLRAEQGSNDQFLFFLIIRQVHVDRPASWGTSLPAFNSSYARISVPRIPPRRLCTRLFLLPMNTITRCHSCPYKAENHPLMRTPRMADIHTSYGIDFYMYVRLGIYDIIINHYDITIYGYRGLKIGQITSATCFSLVPRPSI